MKTCALVLSVLLCVCFVGDAVGSFTVAAFSDPSPTGATPLFQINLQTDLITGGWADAQQGLLLELPFIPTSYANAYFTMTPVTYTGDLGGGATGGGVIKFYADNGVAPVFQIDFEQAHVTVYSFGGTDVFFEQLLLDTITFSGSDIPAGWSAESFAFSFANQKPIYSGAVLIGFNATASFTSSAVPEPITLSLLSLGGLMLARRR